MIVVDVNLLLYAVISGFTRHEAARTWWEEVLNGPDEVGLASPAIFGFLRISTNPRILESPLAVEAATGYVSDWLAQPGAASSSPGHATSTLLLIFSVALVRQVTSPPASS